MSGEIKKFKKRVNVVFDYIGHLRNHTRQLKEINNVIDFRSMRHFDQHQKHIVKDYWMEHANINLRDFRFHEAYWNLTGIFDPRFIPADIMFDSIIPVLNSKSHEVVFSDKNLAISIFQNIRQPKALLQRRAGRYFVTDMEGNNSFISRQDALIIGKTLHNAIIKPTINTGGGVKVEYCQSMIDKNLNEIDQYFESFGNNFIVQEKVEQHEVLSKLNPSSLNTIRMVTYINSKGAHVISATLKIGKKGQIVDNGHAGGFFCGIDANGKLKKHIHTLTRIPPTETTESGVHIEGIQIPNFEEIKHKICACALRLPYINYAGWDVALDSNNNPILIEVNLGVPGLNILQIPNGPIFGEFTEEVLHKLKK